MRKYINNPVIQLFSKVCVASIIFGFLIIALVNCVSSTNYNWYDSSITESKDCKESREQFWHNNKCWNNFSVDEEAIAPEDVPHEIEEFKKGLAAANLFFNGETLPVLGPTMQPEDNNYFFIVPFFIEDIEHSLVIVQLHYDDLMFEETLETATLLFKGDIEKDEENTKLEPIMEGSGNILTDYDEVKKIVTFSAWGTLGKGIPYKLNFDSRIIGSGKSTMIIEGDKAILSGTVGSLTYDQVSSLKDHPEVKILVLQDVPGSTNDSINMHTGILINTLGLVTYVPYNSTISSGGVDLFAAGRERILERGGKIGIHSWREINNGRNFEAIDYPKDHPAHMFQIEYFTQVMGPELGPDFYFRTIHSASGEDMYYMTEDEIVESHIATQIIDQGDSFDY